MAFKRSPVRSRLAPLNSVDFFPVEFRVLGNQSVLGGAVFADVARRLVGREDLRGPQRVNGAPSLRIARRSFETPSGREDPAVIEKGRAMKFANVPHWPGVRPGLGPWIKNLAGLSWEGTA